ncbi:MAG: glucans biosynthesis glucosyltransferase MdoH [Paracoccaceae bacterium]
MTLHPRSAGYMPTRAPIDMPVQRLDSNNTQMPSDVRTPRSWFWRIAVFVPAISGTLALLGGLFSWLNMGGMTWLEWALLALIGLSFVWVALSVSTVFVGLAGLIRKPASLEQTTPPLDVALLVPVYNEDTSDVFGNAQAMLDDLAQQNTPHRFTLFILSDTRDPHTAAREMDAVRVLRQDAPKQIAVHYRRRVENTDKKVGNILDWITGWGAAHEAMLVLDADSLMAGRTITALADALARDPSAGLVQSIPTLIGAETLFARTQQFANIAYGWLLSEGLAQWAQTEGNYWGHNAIIRTHAFAAAAGLPRLKGNRLILSHDFVEAGLLRRAGWRVKFLPRLSGSFEETPATLIDHVLRDRRWCRGNLQHLRLLGTRGLHPVSRFHLFHGAMSYLLSPAWFLLLLAWALLGKNEDQNVIRYFREDSPLYPDWPVMTEINSALFLVIMYAVLLTPKLTGAAVIALHPKAHRIFGGRAQFFLAFLIELLMSILYAPILMIQQCRAVIRAVLTQHEPWTPQNRNAQIYPLATLVRMHWLETFLGFALAAGLSLGVISLWLLPIVISLTCAIPLSALSSLNLVDHAPKAFQLDSPNTLREPAIVTRARANRLRMKAYLDGQIKAPAE